MYSVIMQVYEDKIVELHDDGDQAEHDDRDDHQAEHEELRTL